MREKTGSSTINTKTGSVCHMCVLKIPDDVNRYYVKCRNINSFKPTN